MNVRYICTLDTFRPRVAHPVRWLAWDADYALARAHWPPDSPLTVATWAEARDAGYEYAAIVEDGVIRSLAAVWRYSDGAWELAAVSTQPERRRRGYARSVCSFVTARILGAGRMATCTTGTHNVPMQRTAESLGYVRREYAPGAPTVSH